MTTPRFSQCDLMPLEQLLSDGDVALLPELASHVETCVRCQQKLETLAAHQTWWRDASEYLPSEGYTQDLTHPSGKQPVEDGDSAYWGNQGPILEPSDKEDSLGRLGPYEICEVIGRGGMGIVFKGFEPALNRFVAVKVLAPHLADSAAARKRFQREAEAAAAVIHEHVIATHAIDATASGLPYLVMPLVLGGSLQRRLDRQGPLELQDLVRIGQQAAAGLAAAHAQGLVHRDVKPANILLEGAASRVLLTDFGLARAADDASLTRSGVIAGTPHFMAPEQVESQPVDCRADLFSLGGVLYTMATGRPPFRAELTMAVLRRICDDTPRSIREINPDIPAWLAAIIEKLLAKHPDERFQSATEVSELLASCLAHLQQPNVIALPEEAKRLIKPKPSKRNLVWGGSALAVISVIAISAWLFSQPTPQPEVSSETMVAEPPIQNQQVEAPFVATPEDVPQIVLHPVQEWSDPLLEEIRAVEAELERWEPGWSGDWPSTEMANPLEEIKQQVQQLEQSMGVSSSSTQQVE